MYSKGKMHFKSGKLGSKTAQTLVRVFYFLRFGGFKNPWVGYFFEISPDFLDVFFLLKVDFL